MARTLSYTICYHDGSTTVDLFKIIFGGDGSYYITAPYHPLDRAIAARMTVNYADQNRLLNLADAEDLAALDDDNKRLKVSHHPDGFIQFSGQGILSGLDSGGNPKGIGALRDQAWGAASDSRGWGSVPVDAAVQEEP